MYELYLFIAFTLSLALSYYLRFNNSLLSSTDIINLCFIVPIAEEVIFRYYLLIYFDFGYYNAEFHALLFGIYHLGNYWTHNSKSPLIAVQAVATTFFGYYIILTTTLGGGILVHCFYNTAIYVFIIGIRAIKIENVT